MNYILIFLFCVLPSGNKREFPSPDKKSRAVIYNFCDTLKGEVFESRLCIYDKRNQVMLDTSFASSDGEHGFGIHRAEWSKDSRYLIVGMSSSGGHMPWQVFVDVFSLPSRRIIEINKRMPVTGYRLVPPDSLRLNTFSRKNFRNRKVVTIALADFFRK